MAALAFIIFIALVAVAIFLEARQKGEDYTTRMPEDDAREFTRNSESIERKAEQYEIEEDRRLDRDLKKRHAEYDWTPDPLRKTSRRNCGRKPRGKTLRDKGASKRGRRHR